MSDTQITECYFCRCVHAPGKHVKLEDVTRNYTLEIYELTGKNKTQTANILGVSVRNLIRKIQQYS